MSEAGRRSVRTFEDLDVWKNSRELVRKIFHLTRRACFQRTNLWLQRQMRSAAASVMFNIAEGFERDGNKEFIHFLSVAKGSVGELRSQLYLAADQRFIAPEDMEILRQDCLSISRSLAALIRRLRTSSIQGIRFKK